MFLKVTKNGTANIDAIKWNFTSSLNINDLIDIAFYIDINKWNKKSTYVQHPPFFKNSETNSVSDINKANILGIFGDSVTTDHISPAGAIKEDSPAGDYLISKKIKNSIS